MRVLNDALMAEFRTMACEIPGCGKRPACGHHILCRGLAGGHEITVRINLLAVCQLCHQKIGNASRQFSGRVLRREEQLELVSHREGIDLAVDLMDFLYLLDRLPKNTTAERFWQEAKHLDADVALRLKLEIWPQAMEKSA